MTKTNSSTTKTEAVKKTDEELRQEKIIELNNAKMESLLKKIESMDMTTLTFHKRFSMAKYYVTLCNIKKTGWNPHANAPFYELADFIQPILESCFMFDLATQITYDYEAGLSFLHVIDSNECENEITFSFRFVAITLHKGNDLQMNGAIQTFCRRYLYLGGWDITENDLAEQGSDNNDKQQKADNAAREEKNRKVKALANLKELKDMIKRAGNTEQQVVEQYNVKNKKDIKELDEMPDQQVAAYISLFDITLKKQAEAAKQQ